MRSSTAQKILSQNVNPYRGTTHLAYCVKALAEVSCTSAQNEIHTWLTTVAFLVLFEFGKLTRNDIHSSADAATE